MTAEKVQIKRVISWHVIVSPRHAKPIITTITGAVFTVNEIKVSEKCYTATNAIVRLIVAWTTESER
jgi:hypothetical protein